MPKKSDYRKSRESVQEGLQQAQDELSVVLAQSPDKVPGIRPYVQSDTVCAPTLEPLPDNAPRTILQHTHNSLHYDDLNQREVIISTRGSILQLLIEELAAPHIITAADGKQYEMPKSRAMMKSAIDAFILGETKPFEVMAKIAGMLDTNLLEMNFIQDQRRIERAEIINLNGLSNDEQVKLFDILTKVSDKAFDQVNEALEPYDESTKKAGLEPEDGEAR